MRLGVKPTKPPPPGPDPPSGGEAVRSWQVDPDDPKRHPVGTGKGVKVRAPRASAFHAPVAGRGLYGR